MFQASQLNSDSTEFSNKNAQIHSLSLTYIRLSSPNVASDLKAHCETISSKADAKIFTYFQPRNQDYLLAIAQKVIEQDGTLSVNALREAVARDLQKKGES